MRLLYCLVIFFLAANQSASAQEVPQAPGNAESTAATGNPQPAGQDLAEIEHQVAEFLYQQALAVGGDVQVEVTPLDHSLRFPACQDKPETSLRQAITRHRHSVLVRCRGGQPWSLYVTATVSILRDVVVSQHPLARKQMVDANDLTISQVDITQADGDFMTSIDEAAGLELRRPVGGGMVLTRAMFESPQVIRKGDRVAITARLNALAISGQGEAMENGKAGQQINIRNTQSGRTVRGVVSGPGKVEIVL